MTTATTPARPSLAARAATAWGVERQTREDRAAVERLKHMTRAYDVLKQHLADALGFDEPFAVVERTSGEGDYEIVEYVAEIRSDEGDDAAERLAFTVREMDGHDTLCVLEYCTRHCHRDLWIPVCSLAQLGQIVASEDGRTHDFNCIAPDKPDLQQVAIDMARDSIDTLDDVADRVAAAMNAVSELEDQRALIKPEAIKRIMAAQGIAATPAEKIVESDPEYAAHREKQRAAEREKWAALAAWEAAKLRAQLDVQLVGGPN